MAFLGITLPLNIVGPPIFNLVYGASLDFGLCDYSNSAKDWCSGSFILVGMAGLAVNLGIYLHVRSFCRRKGIC